MWHKSVHIYTHKYILICVLWNFMKKKLSKMFETKNGLEQISSETQLKVLLQVSRLDSMAHGAQEQPVKSSI